MSTDRKLIGPSPLYAVTVVLLALLGFLIAIGVLERNNALSGSAAGPVLAVGLIGVSVVVIFRISRTGVWRNGNDLLVRRFWFARRVSLDEIVEVNEQAGWLTPGRSPYPRLVTWRGSLIVTSSAGRWVRDRGKLNVEVLRHARTERHGLRER